MTGTRSPRARPAPAAATKATKVDVGTTAVGRPETVSRAVPANVAWLQRAAGNRAVAGAVAQRTVAVQRDKTAELDGKYQAAVTAKDWDAAATHLNGFSDEDITKRLAALTHEQRFAMYYGAIRAMSGVSQHRITDKIGVSGEFKNEIRQDMTEGGSTYVQGRFTWTLIDGQLEISVPVEFKPDPGITAPVATWQAQIDKIWNRFVVTEPGGRKVPIHMSLWQTSGSNRKIRVVQNKVPGAYGYPDRANAAKWYPVMPESTAPHEFGHLIGLPDEYQRTHGDYLKIVGEDKAGPSNDSGMTPLEIAKNLHAALWLDDKTKRAAAATDVLKNCGLISGGRPQQGNFAQSVMKAYDDEYEGWWFGHKSLLAAIRENLPEGSNWTLLTVFSYASSTVMGNPETVGADTHHHPVLPRHMREFQNIVSRTWPSFAWKIEMA